MSRELQWILNFSIILGLIHSAPVVHQYAKGPKSCQYDMCNPVKTGVINVHIVAHTHDDVGWLKTLEQYYYGTRPEHQRAYVKQILDSVTSELLKNPERKFIYAEMAFFSKWWNEQSETMKDLVRGLVYKGQLQFICGGWSMNDEASTHYNAIIDQHTIGFRFLEDTFGECGRVRVGWQIDPFGHSREQASIFARFGFDGLFLGRIDQQDKDNRMTNNTMEMMWTASSSLGEQAHLFTSITYDGYYPPKGFCFDKYCVDAQMEDTPYYRRNIKTRVEEFVQHVNRIKTVYSTNNVLITMGGDFHYEDATKSFRNLDKLIKHVNKAHPDINLIYSTPQCYLQAVNQAEKTWPKKTDDFFPYAHRDHSYWTGYFTSRPTFKGYIRSANNFFQVTKQLDAFAQLSPEYHTDALIQDLAEALGDAQHHDAATGTAKQHVADDYNRLLAIGVKKCERALDLSYSSLLKKTTINPERQHFCQLANITVCGFTENSTSFSAIAYNPVARPTQFVVRIPVPLAKFTVIDTDGGTVEAVVIPVSDRTRHIPERKYTRAKAELVFQADLPALGYNTYFVYRTEDGESETASPQEMLKLQDFSIENKFMKINFDGPSGKMKSVDMRGAVGTIQLTQDYHFYHGFAGNNGNGETQASGAYIFRPRADSKPVGLDIRSYKVKGGQLVQEVWQTFNPWVTQVIRLYENAKHIEIEWTVGPIPVEDRMGKEIVSRFSSNLHHDGVFYTDSNGREMMTRRNNHRPTWKLKMSEPIAGNYYPVNSRIFIQDVAKGVQMTILTDRSQGGGSTIDGSIELMVHRRLLRDDSLGVSEPLNEKGPDGKGLIARGKHYILLNILPDAVRAQRDLAERLFMAPVVSFAQNKLSLNSYKNAFNTKKSFLARGPLPDSIHLLTLQSWREKSILVRLEHMYEAKEDPALSRPVTVQLKNLFTNLNMVSFEELTLGANMPLAGTKRLVWDTEGFGPNQRYMSWLLDPVVGLNWDIKLYPMEIRTFEIKIE